MIQYLSLVTPLLWIEKRLTTLFASRFWRIRLITLSLIISAGSLMLFNTVYIGRGFSLLFEEIRHPGSQEFFFWDDIIRQGQHPFHPLDYAAGTHEASQTYRLTVPFLARLLHLNIAGLYALQLIAGAVFLWVIAGAANAILNDKILTFYFLTGFTAIYAGLSFFINYFGHCDGYAYCFMALAFCYPQPVMLFLSSQLAFWSDERAIVNSSFIGLWFLLPLISRDSIGSTLSSRENRVALGTLLVSLLVYGAGRWWLKAHYPMTIGIDSAAAVDAFLWNASIFGDRMTNGLEGMWLPILAAFWLLITVPKRLELLLLGGALSLTITGSMLVGDGTRSLSYGFIVFFFALAILRRYLVPNQLKYLLFFSAFISLLFPIAFP